MKNRRKIACLMTLLLLWMQLFLPVAASPRCSLCADLEAAGFPPSYTSALCALSLAHPSWSFQPLPVTALSRERGAAYDFDFVVEEEWRVAGRSLVSALPAYAPYQEEGSALYDTGFYQASREAVAYFMDPRNFLSEKGVFQFLLLSGGEGVTAAQVEEVLEDCAVLDLAPFLQGGVGETLVRLGEEYDLNPLFLAVRLRQEQGSEGNPLLFGRAGQALGEQALDGYYNPFNLSATGRGRGAVWRSGAAYAAERGWDTPEKGLRGGAEKLAEEYVDKHQNTLYLQKWNVDPRSEGVSGSRNFWAQYMQNVGAAKTEGDFLASCLKEKSAPLSFLIPVYEGMPASCPDPAAGACPVFATTAPPESAHLYPVAAPPAIVSAKGTIKKEKPSYLPLFLVQGGIGVALTALLWWQKGGGKKLTLSKFPKK